MKKSNKSISLPEIQNSGIDNVILIVARFIPLCRKISGYACECSYAEEADPQIIIKKTKNIIRKLEALKDAPCTSINETLKNAHRALSIFLKPTLALTPESFLRNSSAFEISQSFAMSAPAFAVLSEIDLSKLIDPEEIVKLLEELRKLIEYWLKEFVTDATPEQKQKLELLLAGLKAFIEVLKKGGKVGLDEIINFLRIFLKNLLTLLRETMSKKRLRKY